jgi:hypothetical protein
MALQDDPFFMSVGESSVPVFAPQPRVPVVPDVAAISVGLPRDRARNPVIADPHAPRRPSMLTNVAAPKPLKIYANKPPNSKRLHWPEPTHFAFADPYSDG